MDAYRKQCVLVFFLVLFGFATIQTVSAHEHDKSQQEKSIGFNNKSIEHENVAIESDIIIKNKLMFCNEKLYTGVLISYYQSGAVKYEWNVKNGILDGKAIGYYDGSNGSIYLKKYEYNYVNGIKVDDQFEYYRHDIKIPYYNYDSINTQNDDGKLKVNGFDESFYGNLDGNSRINWHQKEGCEIKTDKDTGKSIFPSESGCPSGQLKVYYELHPSPDHSLFTKCYGYAKCFWRSFRIGKTWYFD